MKMKQLQSMLEDLEVFRDPQIELEQYPTGAHLAACMLYTALGDGHIEDQVLASGTRQPRLAFAPPLARRRAGRSWRRAARDRALVWCAVQVVVDLGCGCGVLGIAATLLGAGHVVRETPSPKTPTSGGERGDRERVFHLGLAYTRNGARRRSGWTSTPARWRWRRRTARGLRSCTWTSCRAAWLTSSDCGCARTPW